MAFQDGRKTLNDVYEIERVVLVRAITCTALAPLDRIKYLLQGQGELYRLGKLDRPFLGWNQCARRILRLEGVGSLWRGNGIQLLSIIPQLASTVYVGIPCQQFVFRALPHDYPFTYTVSSLLSGVAGAFATAVLVYPFEFSRFRLAMDIKLDYSGRYEIKNTWRLFTQPAMRRNPVCTYKGMGLYVFGSVLYRCLVMCLMQMFGHLTSAPVPGSAGALRRLEKGAEILGGFLISTTALILLHPVDTVRRRLMLSAGYGAFEYRSMQQCISYIFRAEGPVGFFRGVGFGVFRGAASLALALSCHP